MYLQTSLPLPLSRNRSEREVRAAALVLQTVWGYKELRKPLEKEGWKKSDFQVWRCPVVARVGGAVLQQGGECSWSSAILDFSSYLADGIDTLEVSPLPLLSGWLQEVSTKEEPLRRGLSLVSHPSCRTAGQWQC